MKKIVILIIFNIIASCLLFPEIIVTKDGSIVKGEITLITDDEITINTEYAEVIIEKSKINKIYYSEDEYEKEQQKDSQKTETEGLSEREIEKNEEEKKLNNLYYTNYKRFLPLGVGFLAAGVGVNVLTLATMTPFVYYNSSNPILLSFYISLNATGIILDSVGIVSFVQAIINYSKWKKNEVGYENSESSTLYRTLIRAATSLIVPGAICTSIGLGIGIPIYILPLTTSGSDGSYNDSLYSNPAYLSGISWVSAILSIGLILDAASIVCFGVGMTQSAKWKKENTMSVDVGYRDNSILTEIRIRL